MQNVGYLKKTVGGPIREDNNGKRLSQIVLHRRTLLMSGRKGENKEIGN